MMLLLTDGSVLCQAFQRNQWRRLIPSAFGRYADGQWENLCFCSRNAPSYYASAVLADGKVIMVGTKTINTPQSCAPWSYSTR
jgi:hypothetical protein